MKVKVDAKLDMNIASTVSRFSPRFKRAQHALDSEVIRTSNSSIPMRQSILRKSARAEGGFVTYNTPYARYQYHGGDGRRKIRNYSQPETGPKWFETAKARHLPQWVRTVERIIKG